MKQTPFVKIKQKPDVLHKNDAKYDILLVEDNLINQKVLSRQLIRKGHRVQIANHGQEALDILAKSRFCIEGGSELSCILMDVEMPVMGVSCSNAPATYFDSA